MPGACLRAQGMGLAASYQPRHPEQSLLYTVVADYLETFLARQAERDRPVPRFVEQEFRSFLDCGVLALGFLRSALRWVRGGPASAVLV